jgi:hypothetical protein
MPYRLETLYLTEPDSCLLVASAISSLMKLKGMDPVSNVTYTSRQLDAWVVMMQSRYIVFLMQSRYIAATMTHRTFVPFLPLGISMGFSSGVNLSVESMMQLVRF